MSNFLKRIVSRPITTETMKRESFKSTKSVETSSKSHNRDENFLNFSISQRPYTQVQKDQLNSVIDASTVPIRPPTFSLPRDSNLTSVR